MTAPAYARSRTARAGDGERDTQPRLFALPGGAEAAPVPPLTAAARAASAQPAGRPAPRALALAPAPAAVPAATPEVPAGGPARTLDAELRLAWTALTAGAPAACIVCGGRMQPLAHAAGGACVDCGTTLE